MTDTDLAIPDAPIVAVHPNPTYPDALIVDVVCPYPHPSRVADRRRKDTRVLHTHGVLRGEGGPDWRTHRLPHCPDPEFHQCDNPDRGGYWVTDPDSLITSVDRGAVA